MKRNVVVSTALAVVSSMAFCDDNVERLRELENFCAYKPGDNLDIIETIPSPDDIIRKYSVSTNVVVQDLWSIVAKYGLSETNDTKRQIREIAVSWIGDYGSTNDLAQLSSIVTNNADYAQESALFASFYIMKQSPDLIPFVRSVVTNACAFSSNLRGLTYVRLLRLCEEGKSDDYIDDPAQHERIAAFFAERAAVEQEDMLFIDRCTYTLNPSYRHSQQRRNNLAALRPPNLTGKPAELYDAAQADAAQGD